MTDWCDPRTAFSIFLYVCAFGIPLVCGAAILEALKSYAPPPHGRVLSRKRMADGSWLIRVKWHGRTRLVVGREREWRHRRSGNKLRSRAFIAWLERTWQSLESAHVAPEHDELLDELEQEVGNGTTVIRMEAEHGT